MAKRASRTNLGADNQDDDDDDLMFDNSDDNDDDMDVKRRRGQKDMSVVRAKQKV
jgi:hypothetical protein